MKRTPRLSATLHVLVHLAQHPDERFTSESIARWWRTNPVVVRRTFASLRQAGLVESVTGHGGGWKLARPAAEISLAAIYAALDERLVASVSLEPASPGCLVEGAVNDLLTATYQRLEVLLRHDLAGITLANIAGRVGSNLLIHRDPDPVGERPTESAIVPGAP